MPRFVPSTTASIGAVIAALLLALLAAPLRAQHAPPIPRTERPDLWVNVNNAVWMYRVSGRDTFPAAHFAPSYMYAMAYDSTSRTEYLFTECRRNGNLLTLLHWKDKRVVHADARYLSFNSRTANFKAADGDTVSFYRELTWYRPGTREQSLMNYYALDTLDFTAHLVRASDLMPVALLDSVGVLPCTPVGHPTIYGTRPLMALVRSAVPASAVGDSLFIGISVRARGDGAYFFTRADGITVGVSKRLSDPFYQEYLTLYGSAYAKRDARELIDLANRNPEAADGLTVAHDGGRRVTITAPARGQSSAVAIYDAAGNLLFVPRFTGIGERMRAVYTFTTGGMYLIALTIDGSMVDVKKVVVP